MKGDVVIVTHTVLYFLVVTHTLLVSYFAISYTLLLPSFLEYIFEWKTEMIRRGELRKMILRLNQKGSKQYNSS